MYPTTISKKRAKTGHFREVVCVQDLNKFWGVAIQEQTTAMIISRKHERKQTK